MLFIKMIYLYIYLYYAFRSNIKKISIKKEHLIFFNIYIYIKGRIFLGHDSRLLVRSAISNCRILTKKRRIDCKLSNGLGGCGLIFAIKRCETIDLKQITKYQYFQNGFETDSQPY